MGVGRATGLAFNLAFLLTPGKQNKGSYTECALGNSHSGLWSSIVALWRVWKETPLVKIQWNISTTEHNCSLRLEWEGHKRGDGLLRYSQKQRQQKCWSWGKDTTRCGRGAWRKGALDNGTHGQVTHWRTEKSTQEVLLSPLHKKPTRNCWTAEGPDCPRGEKDELEKQRRTDSKL